MGKLIDRFIPVEFRVFMGWVFVILGVLTAIPLISYGIWTLRPSATLGVVVLDKTVPNRSFQEHQSLHWMLNNLKYKKRDGTSYDPSSDFFGFFPFEDGTFEVSDFSKLPDSELNSLVAENQLFYFADTYGVYEDDLQPIPSGNPSKKIYGGMDGADLKVLKTALEAGKDVIVEFNNIASPTSSSIRRDFENLTDIKWTGWITRYFDELDSLLNEEIPTWLIEKYMEQHAGTWPFQGSGMVFLHENGQIEVLTFKEDFSNDVPKILTMPAFQKQFGLPEIVNYPYWIDIMLVSRDYEVISYYDMKPTEGGLDKMRNWGIPRYFPAVVVKTNGPGKVYYFAGDFVDNPIDAHSYQYFGIAKLWRMFLTVEDISQRNGFFWNYFYPLMESILEDCHQRSQL